MNPDKVQNMAGHHGYQVALFDVLGFESRLNSWGLEEMLRRYQDLMWAVIAPQLHQARLFGEMQFRESPYWLKEGGVFIFNKVHGAYASDSILLWSDRTWPGARGKTAEELDGISQDDAEGWVASPIPCDNFINACNELVCHGIEVGLPLRGALAAGQAIFDDRRRLYLGQPLVECARMEKAQEFIGAGLCKSFRTQIIPKRFRVEFERHLKSPVCSEWGGAVLDWPRHWRATRKEDLSKLVAGMGSNPGSHSKYANTLELIRESASRADQFSAECDLEVRDQYPEFGWNKQKLALPARAVSSVPIGK